MFRRSSRDLEVLIAHPGGPYYARKEDGVWTVPKGLVEPHETTLEAAIREFAEETGFNVPGEPYLDLGEVRLKSGKRVLAFAAEGEANPHALSSNRFEMEWPPRSGRMESFPEVDRALFATPDEAERLLHPAQRVFVHRLVSLLESGG